MGFASDDELSLHDLARWREVEFPGTNPQVAALGLATSGWRSEINLWADEIDGRPSYPHPDEEAAYLPRPAPFACPWRGLFARLLQGFNLVLIALGDAPASAWSIAGSVAGLIGGVVSGWFGLRHTRHCEAC